MRVRFSGREEKEMSKMKNAVLVVSVALLLITVLVNTILAEHGHKGKPSNAEVMQKTQKLQMPFVANEGQIDERVAFYARTFGGTVFVTKDGNIVYSLPHTAAHASPLVHYNIDKNETGYTGLTGYRGEEGTCIVHHALCTIFPFCTWNFSVHYSETNSLICHTGLNSSICHSERSEESHVNNSPFTRRDTALRVPATQSTAVALKEEFIGAKISGIKGEGESVTKVSYFKGNDPSKWKSNISTYELVNLGEIYDGIELKLKAHGNNVEKLLYVKPGAVPEQIKISLSGIQYPENPPPLSPSVRGTGGCPPLAGAGGGEGTRGGIATKSPLTKGARGLSVNEHGELVAETELGPVKFTKPVAYQEINGKRVEVDCKYVMRNRDPSSVRYSKKTNTKNRHTQQTQPTGTDNGRASRTYGFTVASYDRTKDLVIDPLLASTYLGGTHNEIGYSITLDTSGNVYVTGYTKSTDFPTTAGAYDTYGYSGPSYDVFVSKLDSGLTSLLASTYMGGALNDYGLCLALDTSGNVYVTGYTEGGFPTTDDAFDTDFNGYDSYDVFVSKLDSGLTSLLASTYLGGSGQDDGESLALDISGNVYVTGDTSSSDFPTTGGAYDISRNSSNDVFVSKLNSGLKNLLASTFLGGSDRDYGYSLSLDTSGNVYVTGNTYSSDFPTTGGAYDISRNSSNDVFVSKLDSGLTTLLVSTYLGGSSYDNGYFLTLDTSGNVYVTGSTYSADFPTTSGAYDTSYNGGDYDIFVSKLNGELANLLTSTYLGGGSGYALGNDYGYSLSLDTSGNVYVTGDTSSSDFPSISGAYDTSYNAGYFGYYDAFVSKFDSNLSASVATTPTPSPTLSPTPSPNPLITTGAATNITSSSVTLNGTVNANGLTTTAWFEYGKSSGSYSSKSSSQNVSGSNNTTVSIGVSGLSAGITYYYRLVAKSSAGTTLGTEMFFTTTNTEEEDLLKKHAPILYMHGQERFHPTNVEVMLDNSELYEKKCKKKKKTGACKKYEGAQVLDNKDKKLSLAQLMDEYNANVYYLRLKKEAKKKVKKDWKERQTVYARQTKDGKEKIILQYWFFYVYNDWGTSEKLGNTHEGDWEMIQIELGENKQPERISFSYHHGGVTFGWDDKDEDNKDIVSKDGNHPHVYVTLGGHGCWNSPGDHIWYQKEALDCWKCTDKTDRDGDVLHPNSMSESEISEIQSSSKKYPYAIEEMTYWTDKDKEWIYWEGYWGEQTKSKMNGK
ncbi:MAG: hypothetical protein CV087_13155, partial [Candidatus Brocadia sp. WS118]